MALTVGEAFALEGKRLFALPDDPVPADEPVAVSAGKTPYARFDGNDYSIPCAYVQRPLTVVADLHRVRMVDGQTVLATHARSYDRGQQIEIPAHLIELVAYKRQTTYIPHEHSDDFAFRQELKFKSWPCSRAQSTGAA